MKFILFLERFKLWIGDPNELIIYYFNHNIIKPHFYEKGRSRVTQSTFHAVVQPQGECNGSDSTPILREWCYISSLMQTKQFIQSYIIIVNNSSSSTSSLLLLVFCWYDPAKRVRNACYFIVVLCIWCHYFPSWQMLITCQSQCWHETSAKLEIY